MMDIYFVSMGIPSGKHTFKLLNMAIEIVDLPIENGGSFHSCGTVYHRVNETIRRSTLFVRKFTLNGSGQCVT